MLIPASSSIFSGVANSHLGVYTSAVAVVPQIVLISVFIVAIRSVLRCGLGVKFLGQVLFRKTLISLIVFVFFALLANAIGYVFISGLVALVLSVVVFSNSYSVNSKILVDMAKESNEFCKAQYVFSGGTGESAAMWRKKCIGTGGDSSVLYSNDRIAAAYADSDYDLMSNEIYWPQSDSHASSTSGDSFDINPATGQTMVGMYDTSGCLYGYSDPAFINDNHLTNQFSDFDSHNNS